MPPVAAAVVYTLAQVGVISQATFLAIAVSKWAIVLNWVATIGAAVGYSSYSQRRAQKKMAAMLNNLDQGRSVMVRDPIAPRRIVYGQIPVSGPIVFMHVSGTNNEYLHMVVKLADHECEELGEIKFNDEVVSLDGSGEATGRLAGYARVKKFLGSSAGERDTDLETESGGLWTSAHLGKSCARLHIRFKHSTDLYPQGLPTVTCMVKGRKVYDPRSGLTVWSSNAALCLADYLCDSRLGRAVPLARVRSAELIEAANVCDENVGLNGGGTEKRYTCNGAITSDEDPDEVLGAMADAMAGCVIDIGGKWTIRAGAWRTPTLTLTDSDLAGAFSVAPRLSRQETFNGVRGVFYSAINQWAPADFPAVKNDTYMTWDGGVRLWRDVSYRFTTSSATAQRLAKIELERGRQQISVSAPYMLKALQCQPGDVIRLTRDRLGWNEKYFEVMEWSFVVENDENGVPKLLIKLILRETASSVWSWANGAETLVDAAPNTSFLNPASVPTPSGLSLSTSNLAQVDGTIAPRLRVQWSAPASVQVTNGGFVRVEYKRSSSSDWLEWSIVRGDLVEDYVTDVLAGQSYDIRLQFINVFGVRGGYASATATVTADTSAPATPTGLSAVAGTGKAVALDWNDNTEDDLAGYKIYRNTTNDGSTATYIASVSASAFVDASVAEGTSYYYFITAYDRTGNESSKTTGASVATGTTSSGASIYRTEGSDTIGLNLGGATTIATLSGISGSTFLVSGNVIVENLDVTNDPGVTVLVYRGSTVIQTLGFNALASDIIGPNAFSVSDSPGAGSYTFSVKAYRTVSGAVISVSADLAVVG